MDFMSDLRLQVIFAPFAPYSPGTEGSVLALCKRGQDAESALKGKEVFFGPVVGSIEGPWVPKLKCPLL